MPLTPRSLQCVCQWKVQKINDKIKNIDITYTIYQGPF